MPKFEENPFDSSKQNQQSPSPERRRRFARTLLNKEGTEICEAVFELEGNRVISFLLNGNKDGKSTNIDLLALTGATDDKELIVELSPDDRGGSYNPNEHKAIIPAPSNSVAIGVALHEFGHFRQFKTEEYNQLDRLEQLFGSNDVTSIRFLRKIYELIPETQSEDFATAINHAEKLSHEAEALSKEEDQKLEKLQYPLQRQYEDKFNRLMFSHIPIGQEEAFELFESIHDVPQEKQRKRAVEIWNILKEKGLEFDDNFSIDEFLVPDITRRFIGAFNSRKFNPHRREYFFAKDGTTFEFDYFGQGGRQRMNVRIKDPAALKQEIAELDEEYVPNIHAIRNSLSEQYSKPKYERRAEVRSLMNKYYHRYRNLPRYIGERDATFRALQWMRKIKKETGIDLFQEVIVPLKQSSLSTLMKQEDEEKVVPWDLGELFSKFCGSSQPIARKKDVVITSQASLKAGLTTYGALGAQLRKVTSSENENGRIPRILTEGDSRAPSL